MKWFNKHCTPNTLIWFAGTILILAPAVLISRDPIPSIFAYFGSQSIWSIIEKVLYEQTV